MTFLSVLTSLFPFSQILILVVQAYFALTTPSVLTLLLPLFILYLYPVLCFRVLNLMVPLQEGHANLLERRYNPWWGSHQFQLLYFACPFLEAILRVIPGLYSAWLRLWGARIGKNIYWTPNVEIDDRSLLEIGDGVIFGHKVHLIAHVIIPYKGRLSLYVKKISIHDQAFLGAGSTLGPGVIVDAGVNLPVLTQGSLNQHFQAPAPKVKHNVA